jgi:hypothetical protein
MANPSSEQFFEEKYAADADPWAFATSAYEQARYRMIVRALRAIDISSSAVARGLERCAGLENVRIAQGKLPDAIPPGSFDLIVLSEIGYYFAPDVLLEIASQLLARLTFEGVLLAAHWLGHSPDHQLTGDEVHAVLGTIPKMQRTLAERHEGFRLERWTRI